MPALRLSSVRGGWRGAGSRHKRQRAVAVQSGSAAARLIASRQAVSRPADTEVEIEVDFSDLRPMVDEREGHRFYYQASVE